MEVKYFIGLVAILSACTIRGKIQEYSQSTDKICNLIFFLNPYFSIFWCMYIVNSEETTTNGWSPGLIYLFL